MVNKVKSSQTGLNQAQYAQPSSTGYSTQQSSSVDLSCGTHQAMTTTVVSVDEPMEYRGQTYYPESMYIELMQQKFAQEEDICREM
jgi:hypothetical protein